MDLNEYQTSADKFSVLDKDTMSAELEAAFGLAEEVGELVGKFKRRFRGDKISDQEFYDSVSKELGDVLWYVARIATVHGYNLDIIARANLLKLAVRAEKSKIMGNGDDR